VNVCRLFADDVKICRPIVYPEIDFGLLQKDLDNLNLWTWGWQLKIAGEKSQILHVNFKQEAFLRLNGVRLSSCSCVWDLGVFVSSNMKWKEHGFQVAKKASFVANNILRGLSHRCLQHFTVAFTCYCRPILEYCSPIWFSPVTVRIVENVQRRFTRVAFQKTFPFQPVPGYEQRLLFFRS